MTAEDGETAWKRLFDRAEAYDVERATVRAALARRRADSTTAADAEDDDA